MHHALASAGKRTKPDDAVTNPRKPSRERRKAAVRAFESLPGGDAFDVSDESASESEGEYESAVAPRVAVSM
jgi:hypothetical protein